jgi:hypothetical protein
VTGRFGEARLLDDSLDRFRRIGAARFAFEAEARSAELQGARDLAGTQRPPAALS